MQHTADETKNWQTEAELELSHWQGRLSLKDWDLAVQVVPDLGGARGKLDFDVAHRIGRVTLLSPASYGPGASGKEAYYLARTLVHELVHLTLTPWTFAVEPGSAAELMEEWTVNALTDALLPLSFERHSPPCP